LALTTLVEASKMNPRIKELMTQAGTDTSGKWMGVDHAEKFAELILQECLTVALYGDEHAQARINIKTLFQK
jgi:hypothetical protein